MDPVVDIVMLVHDQAGWADLAIRAVEHHTRNKYRLIIVDSASKEAKTIDMLAAAEKRGHTIVRLAENRSFSHGVNAGVSRGTAPFIVILNDDALVTEGWDTALLQDAAPKHVGLVGARSNYASGPQGNPAFIGDPPYLVFVCVALRRAVWDGVGPMDEITFDGFSSEDLDYSWRVLKSGLKLVVSNAYVLHAGSRTLAATTGDVAARMRNDSIYNARLIDKWGKEWVKAHSGQPGRVLVVTYHAEEWTRVKFMGAFAGLKRSDGVTFSYYHMTRAPIHMARETMLNYAFAQGFEWLVQLDDDAVFPEDAIRRLLVHNKDVVTALAYQRRAPYLPCIFELDESGMMGNPLEGVENTGLRRVDVSGFHCSVINVQRVVPKLRAAGIEKPYGGFDNKVGEDFAFCLNLKKIGVPVHCDTNFVSGHIGEAVVVDTAHRQDFLRRQQEQRQPK
jgi:GT2 family glycosyltransferase